MSIFKTHLARKRECKPRLADIPVEEVREQYAQIMAQKRRKRLRYFGAEKRDYIKREFLKECISDPLKGVQTIIAQIYLNDDHEENHNIRYLLTEPDSLEIYKDDKWVKRKKQLVVDKMIYMACDILEYNVPKKYWTTEFANFISGMGELDNDDLLELIREEVEITFLSYIAEKTKKQSSQE